jgi:hypothetical protein
MDTVKALNRFRMSVTRDDRAFRILCYLYKDQRLSEKDLSTKTGIEPPILRILLRALYQADFLKVEENENYKLTQFGEGCLHELGVDKFIAPALVDEVADEKEAASIKYFIKWNFAYEPEKSRAISDTIRCLRFYVDSSPSMDARRKNMLIWTTLIHPDSKLRLIIKNPRVNDTEKIQFLSGIQDFEPNFWNTCKRSTQLIDESDAMFMRVAKSDLHTERFSEAVIDYSVLRLSNFVATREDDEVLEKYFRSSESAVSKLLRAIQLSAPSIFQVLGAFAGTLAPVILGAAVTGDFLDVFEQLVSSKLQKKGAQQRTSGAVSPSLANFDSNDGEVPTSMVETVIASLRHDRQRLAPALATATKIQRDELRKIIVEMARTIEKKKNKAG